MSLASEVREINEETRKGGYRFVVTDTLGNRIRIVGARVRKGKFQVKTLSGGVWIEVDNRDVRLA